MAFPPDRASIATTAILQIVADALRAWLRGTRDSSPTAAILNALRGVK